MSDVKVFFDKAKREIYIRGEVSKRTSVECPNCGALIPIGLPSDYHPDTRCRDCRIPINWRIFAAGGNQMEVEEVRYTDKRG